MKIRPVSSCLPVCLALVAVAAHADLAPYSFGASESIQHDDNIYRTNADARSPDWISTTELRAALDQALGRDRLSANAAVDFNRYKNQTASDSTGYSLAAALDWSVPGNLSGKFGADTSRRQYFYGLNGETQSPAHNLETVNHVFANAQLGGVSRWTLFGGLDASEQRYSNSIFTVNNERQWSANAGTRYSTTPDLTFGVSANYTHGNYPNLSIGGENDDFSTRTIDATTTWHASGNSSLDARVGYTTQTARGQSGGNFVDGALNWTWSPPSHTTINVGLERNSNGNTGAAGTSVNANDLTGRSINNVGHITVSYELTSKISLVANAQYAARHYSNSELPITAEGFTLVSASGINRTTSFSFAAHYKPTRTTDLSCSYAREVRRSDAQIALITPAYTDNTVMCTAGIQFN